MSSVNKAILIGRLGQDPELKYTTGGDAVVNFSLATSETWIKDGEKQEKTEWHNIVMWKKLAEIAAEYLKKGSLVYIEGPIQTRTWEGQDGHKNKTTEIVGKKLEMLGGKGE